MQSDTTPLRPCVLPARQRDVPLVRARAPVQQASVHEIVCDLFKYCSHIVADALLYEHGAHTVLQIVQCVHHLAHVDPCIKNGQFYIAKQWRIRNSDMPAQLRENIQRVCSHTPEELRHEFMQLYDKDKIQLDIFKRIGPSRAAGVRSLLRAGLGSSSPAH